MEDFEKALGEICGKSVEALTESDQNFLKARADYLSKEDLEKFKTVLKGVKVSKKEDPKEDSPKGEKE